MSPSVQPLRTNLPTTYFLIHLEDFPPLQACRKSSKHHHESQGTTVLRFDDQMPAMLEE